MGFRGSEKPYRNLRLSPYKILRLLLYPERGIFLYSPILILSVFGLYLLWKKQSRLSLSIAIFFLGLLVLNSLHLVWSGGLVFGPRYMVPSVAFLCIPLALSIKKCPKLAAFLITLSILISFSGLQALKPLYFHDNPKKYREQLRKTNTLEVIDYPLFNHHIPLSIVNGPRSKLLEGFLCYFYPHPIELTKNNVNITIPRKLDIRYWSPMLGDKDKKSPFPYISIFFPFFIIIAVWRGNISSYLKNILNVR